jgi:hypothetical protein
MSVYIEFRDGHPQLDQPSCTQGALGPVLGPFIAIRLLRDELRVTTRVQEYSVPRVSDWVFYGGIFYADLEIVGDDQMGMGRQRRKKLFDPADTTL